MAWIFLAESEGSHSAYQAGSSQSPIVSVIDTAKLFLCPACQTVNCLPLRSGMTLRPSTFQCCLANWTSSTEASHAKISVLRELGRAWEASEVVFFNTSRGLSKKQTRDSYFSKTSQQLELVASMVSLKHLPSWGMIVGGRLSQPPKLEPVTSAKDGFYWPTPTSTRHGNLSESLVPKGNHFCRPSGKKAHLTLDTTVKLWPTPRASDGSKGTRTIEGALKHRQMKKEGVDIVTALRLNGDEGGGLNPTWVEWLMGYQTEWTVLEDWAMQWFRPKRAKRSKNLSELESK